MASQLASELGLLTTISVLPPSSVQASATFFSSAALLAASTTLAPAPASTLAASAPNAPDAPVTIALLPRTSNSERGFFKKSSDIRFSTRSFRDGAQRRARNPQSRTVVMDSGFASFACAPDDEVLVGARIFISPAPAR